MKKINLNKPRKEWTDEEWDAYDELRNKKMLQLIEETRERESRERHEKIEQDIKRIKSKPLVEASEENLNRFYKFYFEHGIINEDLLKDDIEIKKEIQTVEILEKPNKIDYVNKEQLNPYGAKLLISYSDGSTETTSDITLKFSHADKSNPIMPLTYENYEVNIPINITEKEIVALELQQKPNKLNYIQDEP